MSREKTVSVIGGYKWVLITLIFGGMRDEVLVIRLLEYSIVTISSDALYKATLRYCLYS